MSQVITAFVLKTSSQSINDAFTDGYRNIGRHEVFGLPLFMYYLAILAIIVWYVFEHTPVGRHMFATGGNPEAARLAGLRTDRLIWGSLIALGNDRRVRRHHLRLEGRQLRPDRRTRLPVPGHRRRVLRGVAAQGPPERVGHLHRPVCPRLGHQGTAAHVHVERAMDRAAVPRPVAAGRRVAGQSPGRGQGAQEQGSRHGASRAPETTTTDSPAPAEIVP